MKFQVGDDIKVKSEAYSTFCNMCRDKKGKVTYGYGDGARVDVAFEGNLHHYNLSEKEIEITRDNYYVLPKDYIKPFDYTLPPYMGIDLAITDEYKCNFKPMKINLMMKRLLDANTKKLIKGGLINGDLELTDEGIKTLQAIVFEANKAELVKIAEENIKEEKEDC